MALEGGPFIITSFLFKNNEYNRKKITLNLRKLNDSVLLFDSTLEDSSINQNIESGYTKLEGKIRESNKPFDLHIYNISKTLMVFDFNFVYYTGINGDTLGFTDENIKNSLVPFFKKLHEVFDFDIGILSKEKSVSEYFKTSECWPHDDFNVENFDFDSLGSDKNIYYQEGVII